MRTCAILFCTISVIGCAATPAREVTLIARGMTFVLVDRPDRPNPVIPMRAGERIRLVLKNEAAGLVHDIAMPAWEVAIDPIRAGETGEVTFTVPTTLGRSEYHCRPHAELMNGFVEVTP